MFLHIQLKEDFTMMDFGYFIQCLEATRMNLGTTDVVFQHENECTERVFAQYMGKYIFAFSQIRVPPSGALCWRIEIMDASESDLPIQPVDRQVNHPGLMNKVIAFYVCQRVHESHRIIFGFEANEGDHELTVTHANDALFFKSLFKRGLQKGDKINTADFIPMVQAFGYIPTLSVVSSMVMPQPKADQQLT